MCLQILLTTSLGPKRSPRSSYPFRVLRVALQAKLQYFKNEISHRNTPQQTTLHYMEGKSPGEEDLGHVPVLVIFLREKKNCGHINSLIPCLPWSRTKISISERKKKKDSALLQLSKEYQKSKNNNLVNFCYFFIPSQLFILGILSLKVKNWEWIQVCHTLRNLSFPEEGKMNTTYFSHEKGSTNPSWNLKMI